MGGSHGFEACTRSAGRSPYQGGVRHVRASDADERREPRGDSGRGGHRVGDRQGRGHEGFPRCHGYGSDRAVHGAERPHRAVHLLARRQFGQHPVHPAGERQDPTVRLLHSRRRHGDDVLLLRQLPRLGPDDRGPGRRGGHGRFPQRGARFVGAGGRALSGRSQRLCLGPEVGPRQCGETGHRHQPRHRRRRERRRQPDAGDRAEAAQGTATSTLSRASTLYAPTSRASGRCRRTPPRPRTKAS